LFSISNLLQIMKEEASPIRVKLKHGFVERVHRKCRKSRILSGAWARTAGLCDMNQRAARWEAPFWKGDVRVTAAKALGGFAKKAHELPAALFEFLPQLKIRAVAQRARRLAWLPRCSTPALGKDLLSGHGLSPLHPKLIADLAFSGLNGGGNSYSKVSQFVGVIEWPELQLTLYAK
jgi:hypothetical protein